MTSGEHCKLTNRRLVFVDSNGIRGYSDTLQYWKKTAICLECQPHFLPGEFITGGHFKRYQMCETFALITPSDGSPGLMAAICVCCGTRLKHRQSWQAGRNKRMGGIKSKKFINNSPCPLESCCLFNNAWPPQVSLPALTQMQRALWVNMETREEDKPDPHQSDDPPTWSAASHWDGDSTFCVSSLG